MGINTILQIYKNELAQANEQKILLQAQCKEYEQRIEQLEQQVKEQTMQINELQKQIPKVVEE